MISITHIKVITIRNVCYEMTSNLMIKAIAFVLKSLKSLEFRKPLLRHECNSSRLLHCPLIIIEKLMANKPTVVERHANSITGKESVSYAGWINCQVSHT